MTRISQCTAPVPLRLPVISASSVGPEGPLSVALCKQTQAPFPSRPRPVPPRHPAAPSPRARRRRAPRLSRVVLGTRGVSAQTTKPLLRAQLPEAPGRTAPALLSPSDTCRSLRGRVHLARGHSWGSAGGSPSRPAQGSQALGFPLALASANEGRPGARTPAGQAP